MNNFQLDLSDIHLKTVSLHHVGNCFDEEGFFTAENPLHIADDATTDLLKKYLISGFSKTQDSKYTIDSTYSIHNAVQEFFDNEEAFHSLSKKATEELYNCSVHPKIRSGEVYFVQIANIRVGHEYCQGLGVFKASSKDFYLQAEPGEKDYQLGYAFGNDLNKCDYGLLILDAKYQNEFMAFTYQNAKKDSSVDLFWTEQFAHLKKLNTNYDHTANLMAYVDYCI
jgi:hypothetical protein